ncbi:DUF202 domain-containing protein [Microbispora triticiradicis]|uniref:DUF202 domain-containing protein n=2 Tax=Microbispora TaxID=2005 RepID=A0ABY3LW54_9ACTN|nr:MULTISPECIES: DUF202 domain-containing protein [Microbispora]TLP63839.1 DUF202 domain-containing protein [Microbispora fusca]TYB57509.1 DUF202 domain-containing protein [Microbispora tritici]
MTTSGGGGPRPGLHGERTRLAWVRTAVLMSGSGIGAAGAALRDDLPGLAVPFGVVALAGAVLLLRTGLRHRALERALRHGRPLRSGLDARVAWAGALAAAAGALVLVLRLA